ncbi:S26 family signal peptidase [Streptosporangium sp. NPDC000396]|uniref:S26 family signal peptidase n=1 Tax=Streptosporangium sp. NPDC000396 TaxID=3366185 RepID=UPI00369160FB
MIILLAAGLAALSLALCTVYLQRRMVIAEVSGTSMLPTYRAGERLLAHRRKPQEPLQVGQVVLLRHPRPQGRMSWLVKRVVAVEGDVVPDGMRCDVRPTRQVILPGEVVPEGYALILGDNPAHSMDSRQLGFIPVESMAAVVIRRLGS